MKFQRYVIDESFPEDDYVFDLALNEFMVITHKDNAYSIVEDLNNGADREQYVFTKVTNHKFLVRMNVLRQEQLKQLPLETSQVNKSKNEKLKSISEQLKEVGLTSLAIDVERRIKNTELIDLLINTRMKLDISQKDMAKRMKLDLDDVQEFEETDDYELEVNDIKNYIKALGMKLVLVEDKE